MTHRFFVTPEAIQRDMIQFPQPIAEQIRNVLRLTQGERVIALMNDGWECDVIISAVSKLEVAGQIVGRRLNANEPRARVTLYQCLLKKDHFEWVLQKCTEIGVSRFVPVISRRTVVRDSKRANKSRSERWERILTEAAEQSGRGFIPFLDEPKAFDDALIDSADSDLRVIAWEEEASQRFEVAPGSPPGRIAVFIGPEGGFDRAEIERAREQGVQPITLGSRTLRAETAGIVLATLALHQTGDLA